METETHQLAAIYNTMASGVVVMNAASEVVAANAAAQAILGRTLAQLSGRPYHESWQALTEDGAPIPPHECPLLDVLRMSQTQRGRFIGVERLDGKRRWLRYDAVPVLDGNGTPAHMVVSFIDVTQQTQVEATAQALAEVGSALSSALQPSDLYTLILEQAARVLPCDHAAVLLFEDEWAVIAASRGVVSQPPGTRAFSLRLSSLFQRSLATGKPIMVRDTAGLDVWQAFPPFTGAQTIRSLIFTPLRVDGVVVGTFNLDSFVPNFYDDSHMNIAAAFADRVTQALRNARLYAAEQARARAAEELAALRHDFVAAVSHELRSPLTAIIGYAELLAGQWTTLDDRRRLDHLRRIIVAANRQHRLVEDLLLISQLESAQLLVRHEAVELAWLVGQAVEEVQGSFQGQLIDREGPEALFAIVDRHRALQVITNLLDNAAKYSQEGSAIAVAWGAEAGMAWVRVRDHGPGIPPHGVAHLFTRFGRVPGSRIRAGRVGTGLGLYLGRRLAEAMGGDLELESTSDKGSVFRLRLPLAP